VVHTEIDHDRYTTDIARYVKLHSILNCSRENQDEIEREKIEKSNSQYQSLQPSHLPEKD